MISSMSRDNECHSNELAELARIELTEEEVEIFNRNLKKILGYMQLIDEVDTKDVLPCAHVLETIYNVMSEDEEGPLLPREIFLANAPDSVGGMIKIPPVMQPE